MTTELEKLRDEAIKIVEKDTGKKFKMKPSIRWGRGTSRSTSNVHWGYADEPPLPPDKAKVKKSDIVIDHYLSKGNPSKLLKSKVVHEVRESLGSQYGESPKKAHARADKLEHDVIGEDMLQDMKRKARGKKPLDKAQIKAISEGVRDEWLNATRAYSKVRTEKAGTGGKQDTSAIKKGKPYFCSKCKDWHTKKDVSYLKHVRYSPYWEANLKGGQK